MAKGIRLNQLQDGLTALKKATDTHNQNMQAQYSRLEAEMFVLKKQSDTISQQLSALMEIQRGKFRDSGGGSGSGSHGGDAEGSPRGGDVQTRTIRLDFPVFHGEDPAGWIYKVHQFFSFHNTLPQQRLRLTSFHMEGKALTWFQNLEESGQLTDWESFLKALLVHFGPNAYDDPMESLTRLRQMGSVEEYKDKFESLSNRLRGLSEPYMLSCFLSGLRDDIRLSVRMFNPPNLTVAYSLAKIQGEKVNLAKKSPRSGSYYSPDPGVLKKPNWSQGETSKGSPKPNLQIQKISQQQMKERREKGLCYYCDTKWNPQHKCQHPKLYLLEGVCWETEEEEDRA
ncbi:hypothetical protein F2P56_002043 [Juglans regia]|uniref:Retrotransposon gag domain-containing protein n=1 Tax=Juglans regia TaxID=51240 RepID=A0A833Y814_JUGRE|nr:hypothetical protein F2P56_002043 [Juglans regia]